MARRYWDVRAFGGVMSTGEDKGGQLTGPLQFTALATSADPIRDVDLTITRTLPTTENALAEGKEREIGSKHTVPYALDIHQTAAPDNALAFMLVGASVAVPLILGYTAWVYWVFRGKVTSETGYH